MTLVAGLDVGATKVAAALIDVRSGSTFDAESIPTLSERGGAQILASCVSLVEQLTADTEVAAVGIGVCELVDLSGRITSNYSFDWRDVDVAAAFSHIAPATVESDVRAAARAEGAFGAGRGLSSFLYVNVGSGISSALVLEGEPYAGARGNAILIGAGPLDAEREAGGTGLARTTGLTAAEAAHAAATGDRAAATALELAGSRLGEAVAFAVNLLDPASVVLGGGLALGSAHYRSALEQSMRQQIWAADSRGLPLLLSELGDRAGVVGAGLACAAASKELIA